jgi:ribosome maturation factor RimP
MEIRAKLADLAAESLNKAHFLVDVVASAKNLSKITLIIDGDQGVTIDDCSELSRAMSAKLDAMDFGQGRYVLEVTTPGLDQPLKLKRQYVKNIGRSLKIHRQDKSIIIGKLVRANDAALVVMQEVKEGKIRKEIETVIAHSEIEKAFIVISFN